MRRKGVITLCNALGYARKPVSCPQIIFVSCPQIILFLVLCTCLYLTSCAANSLRSRNDSQGFPARLVFDNRNFDWLYRAAVETERNRYFHALFSYEPKTITEAGQKALALKAAYFAMIRECLLLSSDNESVPPIAERIALFDPAEVSWVLMEEIVRTGGDVKSARLLLQYGEYVPGESQVAAVEVLKRTKALLVLLSDRQLNRISNWFSESLTEFPVYVRRGDDWVESSSSVARKLKNDALSCFFAGIICKAGKDRDSVNECLKHLAEMTAHKDESVASDTLFSIEHALSGELKSIPETIQGQIIENCKQRRNPSFSWASRLQSLALKSYPLHPKLGRDLLEAVIVKHLEQEDKNASQFSHTVSALRALVAREEILSQYLLLSIVLLSRSSRLELDFMKIFKKNVPNYKYQALTCRQLKLWFLRNKEKWGKQLLPEAWKEGAILLKFIEDIAEDEQLFRENRKLLDRLKVQILSKEKEK